jgi:hypothetical protein
MPKRKWPSTDTRGCLVLNLGREVKALPDDHRASLNKTVQG